MNSTANGLMMTLIAPQTGSDDQRVEALIEIAHDLLMEVEALRETVARLERGQGSAHYRQSYEETAYLTHDATGPSGGLGKLLARFYPRQAGEEYGQPASWREALMMRRLGMSEEEIEAWKERAREAETYT